MSDPYPLPSYAAHIWAQGQNLVLQFPPLAQGDQSSTITFPLTERGVAALLRIMQERSRASDLRLGFQGTPCKAEIEGVIESDVKYKIWLAALNAERVQTAAEKAQARAELEELGL